LLCAYYKQQLAARAARRKNGKEMNTENRFIRTARWNKFVYVIELRKENDAQQKEISGKKSNRQKMMNRIIFTGSVSLLMCITIKAQENRWVNYSFREISGNRTDQAPDTGRPMCYFIQTYEEFDRLCSGSKTEVNFFKETVLGVNVSTFNSKFRYSIKKDPKTDIIHFMVYYGCGPSSRERPRTKLAWIAIPKPANDYEVHVHFYNFGKLTEVKVFKNDMVNYPYRVISTDCTVQEFSSTDSVSCQIIQTRDEYNKWCNEKKSKSTINFFKEIVLGVQVLTTYDGRVPDFRYIIHDTKTGSIHIMVYFDVVPRSSPPDRVLWSSQDQLQSWVALQKPIGNAEIHLHFVNWNGSETRVFKNIQ
jgi:hypothetical protein